MSAAAVALFALVNGHVVPFQFLAPQELGARSDGGFTAVQWLAGPDATGAAEFSLYAARDGIPPFTVPRYDATIDATSRPPVDGVIAWDTRALAPGCYQPFAQVDDQIEGTTWRPARGVIAIGPPDGGNVPPAIWVTSPDALTASDGGVALAFRLEDPEDPSTVAIDWVTADGGRGPITSGLAFDAGAQRATVVVPLAAWPASSHLRVEVRTPDGRTCAAYWAGSVTLSLPPEADAGAPASDAGMAPPPPTPRGCGCGAGPDGLWLLLAALTAAGCGRRRRA